MTLGVHRAAQDHAISARRLLILRSEEATHPARLRRILEVVGIVQRIAQGLGVGVLTSLRCARAGRRRRQAGGDCKDMYGTAKQCSTLLLQFHGLVPVCDEIWALFSPRKLAA